MSFFNSLMAKGIIGTASIATPITLACVFWNNKNETIDELLLKEIDNFEQFKRTDNNKGIEIKKKYK